MTSPLSQLAQAGVSIWLDDLSRDRLTSGSLARMVAEQNVTGVTTNPTIFASALADSSGYATDVAALRERAADVREAIASLMAADVQQACDVFADVYRHSDGYDGRVSIEVDPELAHDTRGTLEAAQDLWGRVDRPNCMVKIPATAAGLPAVRAALAQGISVNVTLIFSLERYRQVMEAHMSGLEQALAEGRDISSVHSVASFFISRVDAEVDKRLERIDTPEALELRGRAAVANAHVAHEAFRQVVASERWQRLAAEGANLQRPLWASTSTKNPEYPDTKYVAELITDGVVNTMPEPTLHAFADHGEVDGDAVVGAAADAHDVMEALQRVGVDMGDVFATLERQGVEKFIASGKELQASVSASLEAAQA